MPHIDITLYDFLSDLQGLVPDDPGMTWISGDGDPASGCLEARRVSGGPTVITAVDTTKTWETLGVPPGSYVTGISDLGVNGKLVSPGPVHIANVGMNLEFRDMANNHIYTDPGIGFGGATLDVWFSDPGTGCGPTSTGRASNTPLKIVLTATLIADLESFTVAIRSDTWRLRILYQDANIGSCCDLQISPLAPTVAEGATQLFTATGDSTPVTWSATWGTIDAGGLYTAPAFPITDTVTATSIAAPTCSKSTSVHVTGVVCDLSVSPSSLTIAAGGTQAFTASGTSLPVTWSTDGGIIDGSGHYTATLTPGSYTVTATSDADPACFVHVPVTVTPLPVRGPRYRRVGPMIRQRHRERAVFTGHGFWGKPIPPVVPPLCSLWRMYVKGFQNGESLCDAAYGLPTEFVLCTLGPCHIYTFQQPMVDNNGMLAGRPALFKCQRDATDARNTETRPQALVAVELIYDKA